MRRRQSNPRWLSAFDDFPLTSVDVGAKLFPEVAAKGWTIVLSHERREPIGHLTVEPGRYQLVPGTRFALGVGGQPADCATCVRRMSTPDDMIGCFDHPLTSD